MKVKYLYGFLAASLLLSVSLIAEAKLATNGVSLNGKSLNGTSLNGIELNTNQITPAASNGTVRVEGGQLVIQTAPIAQ